jgi:hypothetical protein
MNISFAALVAAQVAALIAAVIALHSGGHDTATRDAQKGKDDTT